MVKSIDVSLYDIANMKHAYDALAKHLLSSRVVLGYILKDALLEYVGIEREVVESHCIESDIDISATRVRVDSTNRAAFRHGLRTRGISCEDATVGEGTVYYDLRFMARSPQSDKCDLIVNIEAQRGIQSFDALYHRAVYYACRCISSQNGVEFTHAEYHKIKKVYSIWICYEQSATHKPAIMRYSLHPESLFGTFDLPSSAYDLVSIVVVNLGKDWMNVYNPTLRLLGLLFDGKMPVAEKKAILREEFYDVYASLWEGVEDMCSLSEGLWEEAMGEGLEKGIEKGRAEGLEKGKQETLYRTLCNVMAKFSLTMEEAMEWMAFPESDRQAVRRYTASLSF